MKAKQLPLFGPVDWDLGCQSHQFLGGELRRVLAADDGGDNVGRQQGKSPSGGALCARLGRL
jgi:hypothetical protein